MSDYLTSGSYIAIVVILVLSGMGLPVPEEVPIIAAGVLSAHDQMSPGWALVCCVAGALVGDTASYWIGRHFGRGLLQKSQWWAYLITPQRETQIETLIQAHGLKVFFLARFLIGIRSGIYVTAGILRIPFPRFIWIDTLCAGLIITVIFGLSYWFGEQVGQWIRQGEWAITIAVILASLLLLGVVGWRYWKRTKVALDSMTLPQEPAPACSEPSCTDRTETPWGLESLRAEQATAPASSADQADVNSPPPLPSNPPNPSEDPAQ